MPTRMPNFLNNATTPLGQAFANLSSVLTNAPSDAERYNSADQAVLTHRKVQGQQSLADQILGMSVAGQQNAPTPVTPDMPATPQFGTAGGDVQAATSPVARAFASTAPQAPAAPAPVTAQFPRTPAGTDLHFDPAQMAASALYAGVDPKTLGGYQLNVLGNQYGARDDRVTNATIGAGDPYATTAQSFDINQGNEMTRAANTNATSRANNADNIKKDYGIESMKEKHSDAQDADTAGGLTPQGTDYAADIYRRTGQLPSLGMGKAAAGAREKIINRAQQLDSQDGRTGADAVAAFADYQGQRAGQRTAGTREAQAGMAVNELTNLIPVAKQAFAHVARTGFVPADQLLQAYQNGTNDPDLNQAAVAVNDVVNAHARAINPNGQVTDAGRAQGYQLLNTAKDQTAFNAILDQMAVGAGAALKSPGQTRAQLHAAGSAPLAAHGAEAAPAAPAAGGWTVKKVGQ